MVHSVKATLRSWVVGQRHIAPLAVFRMVFGSLMLLSTARFIQKGWVYTFYIKPPFHFTFYGFSGIKPLDSAGMYCLFGLLLIASLLITIGLFYRIAILTFFLCFTYIELIDKTTYLNHYYLVSLIAFLLVLVPAHRYFSIDVLRRPDRTITIVPAWTLNIFKLQFVLVYFFAGLSKLNYDWLLAALPLKLWLPANSHLPVIGPILAQAWVAYAFSWFGALFDLAIGFLLLIKKTRKPAYVLVVVFHLATSLLFKIGMFPYIMIGVTTIFFSGNTHLRLISLLKSGFNSIPTPKVPARVYRSNATQTKLIGAILVLYFTIQVLLPFRYLLYPGKLYWTEEGYRFSWRVMLMEKGGTVFFHVKNPETGRTSEVINAQYLTRLQEDMMATQPDMILQFAHFLAMTYQKNGIKRPIVTAESYVTLNGSGSRLYIDSTINLATEQETFGHKRWILPFSQ
ncbi:HTTM domain-containing protein [Spirosoma endbachense]|uniref:HTTM domain-containing protein n=1 Tax=Spirosoma endbachense TaxID=2666025 RepID=A0A6P1VUV9_9BACT|nr:HTTM domain-containing protein [Spirosoma endbachense]QHV96863.1 HTTM domain-containing protein [Spirosoma endbachense]